MARKMKPSKDFDGRLLASKGRTGRAIAAVTRAIDELQCATDEQQAIVVEIDDEIGRLASLQSRAETAAQDGQNAVDHLKGLIA